VKTEDKSTTINPVQEKMGLTKKEVRNSKLYSFVNEWYGTPYKYGGCQKTGVDCSCFTDLLYEHVYGMKTARTAGEIYKDCDKISLYKIKECYIFFFITSGKSLSHVGVYLKNDKFAHASTSKGVMISDLKETYYKKTFYSAGRLKHSLSWKD
jgi:lipoprotein Spr